MLLLDASYVRPDSCLEFLFATSTAPPRGKYFPRYENKVHRKNCNSAASSVDIMNMLSFSTQEMWVFVWLLIFFSVYAPVRVIKDTCWWCWLFESWSCCGLWFLISYHFLSWRSIYEDITWICHFGNPTAVYMVKGRDLFVNEWLENYACHTCASWTLG